MTNVSASGVESSGPVLDRQNPSRSRASEVVAAAVLALLLSGLFLLLRSDEKADWMYDLLVFRKAGDLLLQGETIYWSQPRSLFTHTPFNAIISVPLVLVPLTVSAFLWNATTFFCLQMVARMTLDVARVRSSAARAAVMALTAGAAFVFDPLTKDLLLGQFKSVAMCLALVDLLILRSSRRQGVLIGILTGLFLLPGLFVGFWLLTRRLRPALTAMAAFASTVVIGFVFLPRDSLTYWGGLLLETDRVGSLQNLRSQSMASVLARWMHTGEVAWWVGVMAVVLSLCAVVGAVALDRRGAYFDAVCLVGLGTVMASPIAWNHHYVWVTPCLLLLAVRAVRRRSGVTAGLVILSLANFIAAPYTWISPSDSRAALRLGIGDLIASSTYLLNLVILIVVFWTCNSAAAKPIGKVGVDDR